MKRRTGPGDLYGDKDGTGSTAAVKFADVGAGLGLANNSFPDPRWRSIVPKAIAI